MAVGVQVASAEPPRWVIGAGQLGRLRFQAGPLPVEGGGIMLFSIFVVPGGYSHVGL